MAEARSSNLLYCALSCINYASPIISFSRYFPKYAFLCCSLCNIAHRCAQDRVLTSLLSRYEDREGTINADLREAVEMLNSRDESNPGAGSHASPVRNVKIILNRLGKSLTSARPTELQPVSIDDEELVDLATELQDLSPLSSPGSPDVATSDSTANSPCLDVCDEGKQDNADDLVDPGIETNPSEPSSGSEFGS